MVKGAAKRLIYEALVDPARVFGWMFFACSWPVFTNTLEKESAFGSSGEYCALSLAFIAGALMANEYQSDTVFVRSLAVPAAIRRKADLTPPATSYTFKVGETIGL